MKYLKGIFVVVLFSLSANALSDLLLRGSANSPYIQEGRVSDLSGSLGTAPMILIEDITFFEDVVARRVDWSGSRIPEEFGSFYPIFKITFHHDVNDSNFPGYQKPFVQPFASYIVEPEIATEGYGTTPTVAHYSAHLNDDLILMSGRYWMSISLLAPNAGGEEFVWQWARANGLMFSVSLDVASQTLIPHSGEPRYGIWGEYYMSATQDADNDGVADNIDACGSTIENEEVNISGCALYQLDSDNDSVADDIDECPGTALEVTVDIAGCSDEQL